MVYLLRFSIRKQRVKCKTFIIASHSVGASLKFYLENLHFIVAGQLMVNQLRLLHLNLVYNMEHFALL